MAYGLLATFVLSGCASQQDSANLSTSDPQGSGKLTTAAKQEISETNPPACGLQLQQLHQQAIDANIADVQDQPLPSFPYLRINRALWAMLDELNPSNPASETLRQQQRLQWLEMSLQLGGQALLSDHQNLASNAPLANLQDCLQQQTRYLLDNTHLLNEYIQQWRSKPYPDDYRAELQFAGLYPLTRELMLLPLPSLHTELRERYQRGPQPPTATFKPARQSSLTQPQITHWLTEASSASPLNLPRFRAAEEQRLLEHFAPHWEIEQRGRYDQPGYPVWRSETIDVDETRPTTFSHISYTRWQGEWLLQLNYLVWFSERYSPNPLSIYSGRLDGLYVRLTLDKQGIPLLLDSIHPCGCYYSIVPLQNHLRLRDNSQLGESPLLLGITDLPAGHSPTSNAAQHLWIAISSADHMLIGAAMRNHQTAAGNTTSTDYLLEPENNLRRMVTSEETGRDNESQQASLQTSNTIQEQFSSERNLYSPPYGLVRGTDRAEKILLWPSGIASPGAMRQRGHHAIAFSSMRHFDDSDLLDQLFMPDHRQQQ